MGRAALPLGALIQLGHSRLVDGALSEHPPEEPLAFRHGARGATEILRTGHDTSLSFKPTCRENRRDVATERILSAQVSNVPISEFHVGTRIDFWLALSVWAPEA